MSSIPLLRRRDFRSQANLSEGREMNTCTIAAVSGPPEYRKKVAAAQGKWWYERYDDWQSLYARLVLDRNDRVQQLVSEGERFLDIGCGFGDMLYLQSDRFSSVHGVDPASVMVEQAAQNFVIRDAGPVDVRCGSAEKLPWDDGFFNTVTMLDVYEHIDPAHREIALKEARRVLSPCGELILVTPSRHVLRFWNIVDNVLSAPIRLLRRRPQRFWKFLTKSFTEEFCTKAELLADLNRSGFDVTDFSRVGFYPAPETMGLTGSWLRLCWQSAPLRWIPQAVFHCLRSVAIWRQKMVIRCVPSGRKKL